VEVRTRQVGTYGIIFNDGHKLVNSQTLQAFDPSKIYIKEIGDAICHRPGTIFGNYFALIFNRNDQYIDQYNCNINILIIICIKYKLFILEI